MRQRPRALKEVAENPDCIGEVDNAVVVAIGGIEAGRRTGSREGQRPLA